MLEDAVKEEIQAAYRQLLASRDLKPRHGQRLMIAEIARCLSGHVEGEPGPVCVVEAGTGTGKTMAYLLAVIPLARQMQLKVVVATATVALQEQVMLKDIPEVLQGSDLDFSVALAKGRGRYLCLAQLDNRLAPSDSLQAMMVLYGDDLQDAESEHHGLYQDMLEALSQGQWQGDRDEWKSPLSDAQWMPLTVDNAQCLGSRCSHFRQCCFFRARDSLDKADVIVSNHDLVLSDLALGGGVILPEPESCFYIFDEAHHLPVKSNNHFSNFARIGASRGWLDRVQDACRRLVEDDFMARDELLSLEELKEQCDIALDEMGSLLQQVVEAEPQIDSYGNRAQLSFSMGQVPEPIRMAAGKLLNHFQQLSALLGAIADDLKDEMDSSVELARREQAEHWFPLLGSMGKRAEAALGLWASYAFADEAGKAPTARWLSFNQDDSLADIGLSASPVLAADNLQERLWERCAGAVLTSATLSALGSFDVLTMRAGLPERTRYLSIPSPFDFTNAATLVVPRMNCEPSDNEKHTALIVKALPSLLQEPIAALMLFSSRRQMLDVMQSLPDDLHDKVLCQDDYQKAQLIKYHRQRVDEGKGSLIFGLASFAEGVDLPGKYCTHVLIAKIPFAVPNDPIETTLSDWVEQQGRNAFITLSVPDAAFRLVQASGRLLRSETDTGRITLFDERVVSKRYGKQILESLPPYRREIFTEEIS